MPPKKRKEKDKKKKEEMEPTKMQSIASPGDLLNGGDIKEKIAAAEADSKSLPDKSKSKQKSFDSGPVQIVTRDSEDYLDEWIRERKKALPLSKAEKKRFINACIDNNLNPMNGEIFLAETGSPFQKGVVSRQPVISFETFLKRINEVSGLDQVIRYKFNVSRETNPLTGEPDAKGDSTFLFQDITDETGRLKSKAINSYHTFWYSNFRRDSSYHRKMPNLAFLRVCFVVHARMIFPRELAGLPLIKDEIQEGKFEYSTPVAIPNESSSKKMTPPKEPEKEEQAPVTPKGEPGSQRELPFEEKELPEDKKAQDKPAENESGDKGEFDFDVPYPETGHKNQSSKASHDEMLTLLKDNQNVIAEAHINRALGLLRQGMTQSNNDMLKETIRKATYEMQKIYSQVENWLENNLANATRVSEVATGVCRALWLSLRKDEAVRTEYADSKIPVKVIKDTMLEAGFNWMLLKS